MHNATRVITSNAPVQQYVIEVYPHLQTADRPLECLQHPGDVIYVPHFCMYTQRSMHLDV